MAKAKDGPKTVLTAQSVAEFIANVEPATKSEDAAVLDAMFRKVTGAEPMVWAGGIIGYGEYRTTYDTGREVHCMRAGFSPRKAKHSLYLQGGYCDDIAAKDRAGFLEQLGKHKTGASCLYINKLADIDLGVLEHMIAADWAVMQRIFPES